MRPKLIEIDDLHINEDNPRDESQEDEAAAIKILFKNKNEKKLFNLMKSIAEFGFEISERIIVIESGVLNKYLVMDGNRRVTCIKLLNTPELLPIDIENRDRLIKRIKQISKDCNYKPIVAVDCVIYDNSSEESLMKRTIQNKHTGENNGVGRLSWDSKAQYRFKNDDYKNYLVEFLDNILKVERSLSTMERIFSSPDLRTRLGVIVDKKLPEIKLVNSDSEKKIYYILYLIKTKKVTVSDVYYKEDRESFYTKYFIENENWRSLLSEDSPEEVEGPIKPEDGPEEVEGLIKPEDSPEVEGPIKPEDGPEEVKGLVKSEDGPEEVKGPIKPEDGPEEVEGLIKPEDSPEEVKGLVKSEDGPEEVKGPIKPEDGPEEVEGLIMPEDSPEVEGPIKPEDGLEEVEGLVKPEDGPEVEEPVSRQLEEEGGQGDQLILQSTPISQPNPLDNLKQHKPENISYLFQGIVYHGEHPGIKRSLYELHRLRVSTFTLSATYLTRTLLECTLQEYLMKNQLFNEWKKPEKDPSITDLLNYCVSNRSLQNINQNYQRTINVAFGKKDHDELNSITHGKYNLPSPDILWDIERRWRLFVKNMIENLNNHIKLEKI
ncbi:hypothetical protein GCM10008018_36470 [Paenibacillus marchantiophytorum]|uniref:ParB/Sulfiredoxin domain-containing protein n=1 Tax=Paenibacillus marchantiophytorum TaxID=1619310 RepID=A0ABQ1EUZ0_9BACL|nr:hypothetical protein [Paenibacillus marchantiophytorum]GFZ87011.1 hypothetical protein GCM10008018_36470 [Paenibacillus marchantiophytorum]